MRWPKETSFPPALIAVEEVVDCGGGRFCRADRLPHPSGLRGDRSAIRQRLEVSVIRKSHDRAGDQIDGCCDRETTNKARCLALDRQPMCANGVTTLEVKSGYGLCVEDEEKMLLAARSLCERLPVSIHTTFLGAHAIPKDFHEKSDDYIQLVCEEMLPSVARQGLADSVDAFCENIAFSCQQVRRVFEKARELGLPVRLQIGRTTVEGLAAEFGHCLQTIWSTPTKQELRRSQNQVPLRYCSRERFIF